jgi:hypothetical protein
VEHRRQQGERGWEHHGRADSLRHPGRYQNARVAGEATNERRDGKQHRPGDEDAATAEQVAGPAAEQHEAAIGEQVARQNPLQALHGEVQIGADVG